MVGPWTLRTVEWRLKQAERERDNYLDEIDKHRREIEWRQSAVETLIGEIEELRSVLIDGQADA